VGPLWIVNITISLIIILALFYVLKTYIETRNVIRSRFVNALIIFIIVFIFQNIAAVYFYLQMANEYSVEMAYPLLVLNLFGLVGFSIFAYVARQ